MKLRTKVILTCILTMICSLTIANVIVVLLLSNSYRNEAIVKSYQSTYTVMEEFKERFDLNSDDDQVERLGDNSIVSSLIQDSITNTEIDYFFKTYSFRFRKLSDEAGYIFLSVDSHSNKLEEIYNNTILDSKMISSMKYDEYLDLQYTTYQFNGTEYVIFTTHQPHYELYVIENISYIWDKLNKLIVILVSCSILLTITTIIILVLILKKILHPLQELNESTKDIANNVYDKRVKVTTKDEIGELGENFNRMAEAVERYTESLEESEKRKTMFMGNLTHELKTPMTAMCGYAQLLLTAKLSEEDREEALMYINDQCNRLERLSKKMMYLMGLDEEDRLEMTKVQIQEIFENAVKSCSILAKEKDIILQINPSELIIEADKDLMVDVMVNLIDNAIKASPNGGMILLSAGNDGKVVEDFGFGIPKAEQDKILEPFYMVDKSRSRKSGGAGLGLALTTIILKKHNMKLSIQSEVGSGTKVILQFV